MATISNNDIKIRYVVETSNLETAAQAFDKLSNEEKQALSELKKFNKESQDTGKNMSQLTSLATKAGTAIAGVFAFSQIKAFGEAVFETTLKFQQFQKVLDFTSGSALAGGRSFQFLIDTSNKLGISLEASVAGYKTLSGAASQAGLSNSQTQKVFENVAQAVKAFGLSSEDAKGVFLALGQIISKGTVQAEELRGQIGERIPGAFSIAAKAIGVTEQELNKMMATGKLSSKDFIIPFTAELAKASEAAGGTNGLAQNVNKIGNAFTIFQTRVGRFFMPLMTQTAALLEKALFYANELLKTQDDVQAEKNQKAYNETLKQTSLLSSNALRAQIQQEEIKLDLIEKQFKNTTDKATADALREQFLIQQSVIDAYKEEIKTREQANAVPIIDPKAAKEAKKFEEEQYARKLQLLRLTRELAQLNIKINFDNKIDILREEYKAEKKYLNDAYNLQVEYSGKGVQAATDAIKVTDKERTLNRVETIRGLKDETQTTLDAINKQRAENNKFDTERGKAQDDRKYKKSKLDQDLFELDLKHQEKMDDLDKQFEEERKKRREQELEDEKNIREKQLQLTQTILQGTFDLYQAGLSNELTLIGKRYEEEVRLADGNKQKLAELEQKRAAEEREIKLKQFRAEQLSSVANIAFSAAPEIVKYSVSAPPLAALVAAIAAAQIGFVLAQPVPEFAEGTKGKAFKGGKAMVGERGVEKVITESGKVYFTPPTATLVDLPKGSHVIPNHALSKQEIYWGSMQSGRQSSNGSPMIGKLDELGSILKGLPITQLNMDERGFEKFIRTPRRTTKILNNRFRSEN
jgi:tape measure domain-containing protein